MPDKSKKYTNSQALAISERGKTVLVSAAAGSGKTFVLIERIIARITDEKAPVGIDKLLVVTFTNAAAAEIKQRLSSALSELVAENPENRRLIRQLALVENSHIQTNDAFFLSILKEHFDKAGLPAGFTVCADENITDALSKKACENVLEQHYKNPGDRRFFKVIENFSKARDDEDVTDFLYNVYKQLIKLEAPALFLDKSIEQYKKVASGELPYFGSDWGKAAARELSFELSHYIALFTRRADELDGDETCFGYRDNVLYTRDHLKSLLGAVEEGDYGKAYRLLCSYDSGTLKKGAGAKGTLSPLGERVKSEKSDISELLRKKHIRAMFPCDEETLKLICAQCAELLCGIKELFSDFDREYSRLKAERSIVDFPDISRKCYDLLFKDGEPTDIARSTAAKFDEIYIDEYQDTNGMQDKIFRTLSELSGAPRFMVGDVKQCIYAFRDSDPSLFMGYYKSFPDAVSDGENEKILLSENFRCDESVVNTVNLIFGHLMTEAAGGVNYDGGARLVFGKDISKVAYKNAELMITDCGDVVNEKAEAEAKNCAECIARLIKEEGYAPSDFAVLFRKRARLPVFRKAIADLGIPINDEEGDDVSNIAEVKLIMAVLSAIDNPVSDIPLAAAMCSPVFGFSYDELALYSMKRKGSLFDSVKECAENGDGKAKAFISKLSEYREYSLSLGIDRLINKICTDGGIDLTLKALPDGKTHYANVIALCEAARSFSKDGGGLSDFIAYIEDGKLRASAASGNGVTLTTIHKSKGLEYKVCILASAHERFSSSNGRKNFYETKGIPATFTLMHSSGFAKIATPMNAVAKQLDEREPVSEALRVLYVGMTRAKERLIISAAESTEKLCETVEGFALDTDICSPYLICNASSQLEWELRALAKELGTERVKEALENGGALTDDLDVRVISEADKTCVEVCDSAKEAIPAKPVEVEVFPEYSYPHKNRTEIKAKLSVSDMRSDGESKSENDGGIFTQPASVRPEFAKVGAAYAAEAGTAMHSFMQFCDFELACKDISAEADRTEKRGFITKRQRELLDEKKLSRFFSSELYSGIKNAKKLYRELRYNLPDSAAAYFDGAEESETVLVQGVIDLFFEDEDGRVILVDFKTDRVSEENGEAVLISRHGFQLSMYKKAIEAMLKKPLYKAYIYSFSLGRAIPVSLS